MQCGQHVRTHENDCSFSHVEKCFMFAVLSAYIAKDSIFVNFGGLEMKIMHLFSLSSLFFPFQQPLGSLGDAKWARKLCKISLKRAFVCGWAKLLEWRFVSFITEIFTAASHYVSTRNESVPFQLKNVRKCFSHVARWWIEGCFVQEVVQWCAFWCTAEGCQSWS